METPDNKIIQEKLNSLDSFEAGYEPNLESKWTLLEAGLKRDKKNKSILLYYKIGIAATILFLGTGALLFLKMNLNTKPDKILVQKIPAKFKEQADINTRVTKEKPEANKFKFNNQRKPDQIKMALPDLNIEAVVVNDSINVEPVQNLVLTEPKVKIKKPRYTEMDFNEPAITSNPPSEPVMAALKFHFRIGSNTFASSKYQLENFSDNGSFKLSKIISN